VPGERAPFFADRRDAGRALAARLLRGARPAAVVLGLPRGGAVVAAEVAAALHAPLDVLVVRKLGVPGQPELAMGAVAAAGDHVETVRIEDRVTAARTDDQAFARVRDAEVAELHRREDAYRHGRPPPEVSGRCVILVDDGLATGATVRAAVAALRAQGAAAVTVAVPVGSPRAVRLLRPEVDELVCLRSPRDFTSVGRCYRDFAPTSDEEVRACLTPGVPSAE
jgi:putative phosphoribosyl transferase